jgi:hypothetical protein
VLVQGVSRIHIEKLHTRDPFYVAGVCVCVDVGSLGEAKVKALAINLRDATQVCCLCCVCV